MFTARRFVARIEAIEDQLGQKLAPLYAGCPSGCHFHLIL
jgi:hypothetical protein